MEDALGDRMKAYEAVETARRLDPREQPIYARIDGRSFSTFTRGLRRPFDERLSFAMIETAKALIEETGALIGYTQSDEISLVWSLAPDQPSQMFFDGKVQKLVSVLSGIATSALTHAISTSPDEVFRAYAARRPHFDARIFALPDRTEATNAFVWRANDASRNAVQMTAQTYFSHRELQGVSTDEALAMLEAKGIDFASYPDMFRHGTFVRRRVVQRPLTAAELARIPAANRPQFDQHLVTRSVVQPVVMPHFAEVANREAFVFDGETPVVKRVEHAHG